MDSNLLLCRPGFEGECAAEMEYRAAECGLGGYARAREGDGYLTFHAPGQDLTTLASRPFVFPRTWWWLHGEFGPLQEDDRLQGLLPMLERIAPCRELRLEYPDTNEGRGMQRFLRRFRRPLEAALAGIGVLTERAPADRRLHLFFRDSLSGFFGYSSGGLSGPWVNGIPRLRLPRAAPSRSALKLEEACLRLMREDERGYWLGAGRSAADLGAAPGGWTWFLASRGLKVTAVDHGRLAPGLEEEYPVTHRSDDAFTWRPSGSLDWVVCDVVDKPARTLAQMEKWLRLGWARVALFNLKLPMKQRFNEVRKLLDRLGENLGHAGVAVQIRAAHLYHDRDEITVLVIPAR